MPISKRRSSSNWWVSYGHSYNGSSRSRKATPFNVKLYTKRQVEKILLQKGVDEFLIALGVTSTKITLNEVKKEYDKEVKARHSNKKSQEYCKQIIGFVQFFVDHIGEKRQPHTIKAKEIEDYLLYRIKGDDKLKGVTVGTAKKFKCFIKQLFETAISMNSIRKGENPVEDVRKNLFPKVTKNSRIKRHKPIKIDYIAPVLTDADIPEHHRLFWKIQYFTGFDPFDAMNIKPEQIDMDNAIPTITNERIKNGEETNLIPIHQDLLNHNLINIKDRFSQKTHKEKLRKSLRLLRSALTDVKYPDANQVDFKCLRHSFNQNLKVSGVDDTDRIQLMGQSELKTNQTYTHRDLDLLNPMINTVRLPN